MNITATLASASVAVLMSSTAFFAQDQMAPTASGFPNGPLTLVVVDDPGSADSIYANQLVEAASALSPVPIRIEHRQDFSNFGTWEAIAWINGMGQQGDEGYVSYVYTVPGSVVDLLSIDMKSEIGVDLDDLNVVVSTETLPYFIHQRADAPWGDTIENLIAYAQENPETVRYISGGIGGSQDAAMRWYLDKMGITVNTIIGGSGPERALTVASGQGDITVSPPDLILPHFEGGRVDLLMVSGSQPSPEPWVGVPSAADLGIENDPWGQTRGIGVGSAVPEEHRAWLEELFTRAAENPDFVARREQVPGLAVQILDSEATLDVARRTYDETLPIMRELGVYWGD
jgi:tripartite-type tricarboxylate transporter receptor subunit TctC